MKAVSKWLIAISILLIGLAGGCRNEHVLTERTAVTELQHHLTENPVFETVVLDYGEVSFRMDQDATLLRGYEQLVQKGYATMELLKKRKHLLSRDSTFTYQIRLTDQAIPYVLEQHADQVTVRTYTFMLDETEPVEIEQTGNNRAEVTVTLKQQETDFAQFADKNRMAHASFIKKTYAMQFDKSEGWKVMP